MIKILDSGFGSLGINPGFTTNSLWDPGGLSHTYSYMSTLSVFRPRDPVWPPVLREARVSPALPEHRLEGTDTVFPFHVFTLRSILDVPCPFCSPKLR